MATNYVNAQDNIYLGMLFQFRETPNTVLRITGGLGNVRTTDAIEFPTSLSFQLPDAAQPAILDGAAAPTPSKIIPTQSTNVVQLFQRTAQLTDLAQSDRTLSGPVSIPFGPAQGTVLDPRSMDFQINMQLKGLAKDLNYVMLNGTYNKPSDYTTGALKSRGILTAVSTNAYDHSGDTGVDAAKYRGYVNEAILGIVTNSNGYNPDETHYILAGAVEYANIIHAFIAAGTNFLSPEVEVAGLKIRTVMTDFGTVKLILEPHVPAHQFAVVDFSCVNLVGMPVKGGPIIAEKALPANGAFDATMLYGQLGVAHGPEYRHAVTTVATGVSI